MSRIGALNVGAAVLSLSLSAWIALPPRRAAQPAAAPAVPVAAAELVRQGGVEGLRDQSGHFVPLQRYERIASTSGVTDSVLLALAEPDRIAAFTRYSVEHSHVAHRFAGKPTIRDIGDVEQLLALAPDLVLVNALGGAERIQKLRDAGLRVFDLGEMAGMSTLLPNIVTIATLLGRPEAGRAFAERFERRMRRLAARVPEAQRPSALYVSVHGDAVYGGTTGSSQHDVLVAAGLRDAAAEQYALWPRYTPEQVLALDPDVLVTHDGMRAPLCAYPGLEHLRACGPGGRIVELSSGLLDDPSLTMLDAAEAIFDAVHAQ